MVSRPKDCTRDYWTLDSKVATQEVLFGFQSVDEEGKREVQSRAGMILITIYYDTVVKANARAEASL